MINWHKVYGGAEFVKYQYKTGPYRVIVHKNERGHYEALFTSIYGPPNVLIRGNCGGGKEGRLAALAAAQKFMADHPHGSAPPKELVA